MTSRLIAIIAAAALIAFLAIFGPAMCDAYFSEKKARKVEGGQATATLDSIDMADDTEAARRALADQLAQESKELADAVRNAPAGDSNDDALRAACSLRSYRDLDTCTALREVDSFDPAGRDAAR